MVNVKPVQLGKTKRMSFGKIEEVLKMPNLIEIQKKSYEWFLNEGLREVFRDVSGITDFNNNLVLDFVDYKLDETPNYSVTECKERDATYSAALRVTARLLNKETGEIKVSETARSVSSSPSWCARRACTIRWTMTARARSFSAPPSYPTGARGWSMRTT